MRKKNTHRGARPRFKHECCYCGPREEGDLIKWETILRCTRKEGMLRNAWVKKEVVMWKRENEESEVVGRNGG